MEFSFSFKCFGDHRDLHSFPTRRSSDLRDAQVEGGGVHARVAQSDRDGRGDEEEGGRDVEGAGDRTMKATVREGPTFAGESLLVRYVNFVKLPHTVFALPFALLGLLVASREYRVTWRVLGLVVLAFTCARFVALGFNRIADRELDAGNPRTRARELPAGRLSLGQAWSAVAIAAAVVLGAAWALNPLCLALAPVALGFISGYSYAKRFMHWSHLWLGLADGIATPAGYL